MNSIAHTAAAGIRCTSRTLKALRPRSPWRISTVADCATSPASSARHLDTRPDRSAAQLPTRDAHGAGPIELYALEREAVPGRDLRSRDATRGASEPLSPSKPA